MDPATYLTARRLRAGVIGAALTAMLAAGLAVAGPTSTASGAAPWRPPTPQQEQPVTGTDRAPVAVEVHDETTEPAARKAPGNPEWPQARWSTVDVGKGTKGRADNAPVWVREITQQPGKRGFAVKVFGQGAARSAGVRGVLVRVRPEATPTRDPRAVEPGETGDDRATDERIEVTVGYGAFAEAFGGDWASRLTLKAFDDCVVDQPTSRECDATGEALPSTLDSEAQTVTAELTVTQASTSTLALTAAPSGPSGDYTASDLSPSATWQVSMQTGNYGWSYPLTVPPAVNGPGPELGISYSSQSVDGRTSSTNNQTSWLGEGHSLGSGFIERRYVPCAEDMSGGNNSSRRTGDLCWDSDNATIAFGPHAGELVRDGTTNQWRLKDDDGSRIEKKTGAPNGDNNGEYWVLTTQDGTQYWFGKARRYGTDTADTDSVATVPVFGNHAGEPCHASSFGGSHCQQGWRWYLDYVVDTNANSMTYFYANETNKYGRNLDSGVATYDRHVRLKRIEYGTRKGSEDDGHAPSRVLFDVAERCIPTEAFDCAASKLNDSNASKWPDVPYDLICTSSTSCRDSVSPTFFSRKRLTGVRTQVWDGTSYVPVDKWDFAQSFPNAGDGSSDSLWLKSITHTAQAGPGSQSMPKVSFAGVQMPNRVERADDGAPPLVKYRVSWITSATGATTSIQYSKRDCTAGDLPASKDHNGRRCFPVYWSAEGQPKPSVHWFHKYIVTSVIESDPTGGNPDLETSFIYHGNPAWRYSQDKLTRPKYRTWNQFRGYKKVTVHKGHTDALRTRVVHTYLRGMHGDRLSGGGTRQVTRTDSRGGAITDKDRYNGFELETQTFDGMNGPEVTSIRHTPWLSPVTAESGNTNARIRKVAATAHRTALATGGERTTKVATSYDSYGLPTQVNDLAGPGPGDDRCTRTEYNRDHDRWLLTPIKGVETVATACGATPDRPADVISDERMYYDGHGLDTPPTRGRLTKTERLYDWDGAPIYKQVSRASYDAHGRATKQWDPLDRATETTYTPATGGIPTKTVATNPAGQTTTIHLDRKRGLPTTEIDADGGRTDLAYDNFGRLTKVWLADRDKSGGDSASLKFGYNVSRNAASWVSTGELRNDGSYTTSFLIYDSLLRPRQTQAPAPGDQPGRVVTHTKYDSRGLIDVEAGPFYNDAAPSGTIFTVHDVQMPRLVRYRHDNAGRQTQKILESEGVILWRTKTSYGGDRVHTDPPAGGVPTTVITDARGQTTELRRYHGDQPAGEFDALSYTYTPAGRLKTATDPGGESWSYGYDLAGRKVSSEDPDAGTNTSTYDAADQLITSTDAEGRTLWHGYDDLGREIETRVDDSTGELLRSWTYDTVAKGHLTSSTSYVDGAAYTKAVTGYDEAGRPTGTETTIPAAEGALAGTYSTVNVYNVDGSLKARRLAQVPGLPYEVLRYGYDDLGLPDSFAGKGSYVNGTTYSPYGEVLQTSMGQSIGKFVWRTDYYETGTRRMDKTRTDREGRPNPDLQVGYSFDDAGNITSIVDNPGGGAAVDRQCFDIDHQLRLTDAWTTTEADCSDGPSAGVLGTTAAAYWHSYTYDEDGNRATETRRATDGGSDVTRGYAYEGDQPHALTALTDDGNKPGSAYTYDAAGNMLTRQADTAAEAETFDWNHFGQLETYTDVTGETTDHVYTAEGDRLLRKEPGKTTLYLGGTEVEVAADADGTEEISSTRYYQWNGQNVAVRTSDSVKFITTDHQGTANLQIDATSLDVIKQRSFPFGAQRGTRSGGWTGEKGFVGGTKDNRTGLTHLGAREYDPATGRFISVDPILDATDPVQMNGYAYANHSPITHADPTGLYAVDGNQNQIVPSTSGGHKVSGGGHRHNAPAPMTSSPAPSPTPGGNDGGSGWRDKAWGWVRDRAEDLGGAVSNALDHPGGVKGYLSEQGANLVIGTYQFHKQNIEGSCGGDLGSVECKKAINLAVIEVGSLAALFIPAGQGAGALGRIGTRASIGVRASTRAANGARSAVQGSRVVSGRFPRNAGPDDILVRRGADGGVTNYQTYGPDGLPLKRVDVTGRAHGGIDTPHVVDFERHVNPATGEVFVRPGSTVRPATPEELMGLD